MTISKQYRRSFTVALAPLSFLLVPLVAMNFTNEVNWGPYDFLIAAVLLGGMALLLDIILRKTNNSPKRWLLGLGVFLVVVLLWAEMAVGLFGSPIAGS